MQVEAGVPLQICLSRFNRWVQNLRLEKGVMFPNKQQACSASDESQKLCTFLTWSGNSRFVTAPGLAGTIWNNMEFDLSFFFLFLILVCKNGKSVVKKIRNGVWKNVLVQNFVSFILLSKVLPLFLYFLLCSVF